MPSLLGPQSSHLFFRRIIGFGFVGLFVWLVGWLVVLSLSCNVWVLVS